MAYLINQNDVLNRLYNLMGKRVSPGGTDDDLKRYVQDAFDYCWRFYRWPWAMKAGVTADDGLLPEDFDLDGYSTLDADTYAVTWDATSGRLILDPIGVTSFTYQIMPPTLGSDAESSAPFPSARVVAMAAFIYAKKGENPTRADVKQEWDMVDAELRKLAGRSANSRRTGPVNFHDRAGTFTGDVG